MEGLDMAQLKLMLFAKDLDGRDALTIIVKCSMVKVLANENVEKAALELWESEYDVRENFLRNSTTYQLLFDVNSQTLKNEEIERRFYKPRMMAKFDQHYFMYEVWKKSMGTRSLINCLYFIFWGLAFFAAVLGSTERIVDINNVLEKMQSVSATSTEYAEYRKDYEG